MMTNKKAWLPHLGFVLVYTLWGINMASMKIGGKHWDPFVFNGLRYAVVALIFWGYAYFYRRRGNMSLQIKSRDLIAVLGLGVVSSVGMEALLGYALQFSNTSNGAVLGRGLMPAITVIIALILRRIKINRYVLIGLPAAFAGVVIMVAAGPNGLHLGGATLRGDILLLMRSVLGAIYLTLMSRYLPKYPLPLLLAWEMTAGAVALLPFTVMGIDNGLLTSVPEVGWISLLYTIFFGSVLGFALHNWCLARLGPIRSSTYGYLHPITSTAAGMLLLNEVLRVNQIVGGCFVLIAMYFVQKGGRIAGKEASARGVSAEQDYAERAQSGG
ncbi:MAG: DMT family transporter [Gorillibacterium sp.]|nr:DMT family transporter [Gorillibacterium sp.]